MAGATNRIANQGLWIGGGFASDQGSSLFLGGQLGMVVIQNAKAYQLCKITNATGAAINVPVMWVDPAAFTVSAHIADTTRNAIGGVMLTSDTITANDYIWVQVGGKHLAVVSTGAITAGDTCMMNSSDGAVVSGGGAGVAPTFLPLGNAIVTASGNVVGVELTVAHNGW